MTCEKIKELEVEHDRRVTELLAANNREVEARRQIQAENRSLRELINCAAISFKANQERGEQVTTSNPIFNIGDKVEKYTGEARWHGTVVARYETLKGKLRYVIDVDPQGFQMIAVPSQLRRIEP